MQLALTLGVSQTNWAVTGGPASPNRSVGLAGVAAAGSVGTITTSTGASGSGSPLGLLLTITNP
jgi:hypothetical protein